MSAVFAFAGAVSVAFCQWLIWSYAPIEANMGPIQKIFYLHLPLAWWALISFFVVFVASIAWLIRRKPWLDQLCEASAELGLLFSGVALVTGMIWARQSWGVWWTWDPRLTTTLVMWFLYAAYLLLRHMDTPAERRRMVCAVVGIVAFLDVPLVFVSARIFRSIHPAVFGEGGGLSPEMKITALACVASLGLFWGAMLLERLKLLNLAAREEALRRHILLGGDDNG